MRLVLAVITVAAIGFSALVYASSSDPTACPNSAQACDVNGDGNVSILDLADVAKHFGETVPTPYPCLPVTTYTTPLAAYSADGTHVADVYQGQFIDASHPQYGAVINGTAVVLRPCNSIVPTATP